ncbi:MAG TPA: hypothetical protein PKC21_03635 [Oligoflexia bacterium]|nr:hypothetical protein [Oligoflexia bacterium]HMR24428.1 hypothetical protein [Oligoflexia bacterium]
MRKGVILIFVASCLAFSQSYEQVQNIDQLLQIYVVQPHMRSKEEKVTVKRLRNGQAYAAKIAYWRSLKGRDSEQEVCNAYRWLLFGRGKYGQGAADIFMRYPKLRYIELEFFDVDYTTVLGKKKGEVLPARRPISYLRLGVKPGNFPQNRNTLAKLKKKLYKGNCIRVAQPFIDKAVFDEKYIQQAY